MLDMKISQLRRFNGWMGLVHLVQGLLMILVSNQFKLPVTTSYLAFDSMTQTILTTQSTLAQIRIGPLVAVFLLLSALAHFLLASPGIFDWYRANLKREINPARWYEYALSSSLMIVVIAMLCGMSDLSSLILIFSLNATMNLFGLMMELHNQSTTKTNWTAYIFGCLAGLVPWLVIGLYFYGAASSVATTIPAFVYAILISIFVCFSVFALNMWLQYKRIGPWKDYLYGERVYIILSLLAKSALAWQIFSGTLRPQ
ncbi:MAG: hypothetical protein CEO22_328 [Candidatus Berkelbacteria bacterium Gr01-1014_85]|uniref:Heliorhodopsin HeR n=1 Tax=Candidatus Berkelbacteria bacterium Gr01-1014_85 TaxID=2017150 RepID=A0A554JBY5_9BACT|nr:MAG: hypothetical protein CEO22_328 [Candidatus Berkelbacteria bacterium Gr01-1014_85]